MKGSFTNIRMNSNSTANIRIARAIFREVDSSLSEGSVAKMPLSLPLILELCLGSSPAGLRLMTLFPADDLLFPCPYELDKLEDP